MLIRLASLILIVFASMSHAQSDPAHPQPVLIELFTSQGCSSCPPADHMLAQLAERDDVIPLALHVDYWDYIGWKDTFARPEFTARQKAYAAVAGRSSIYTPQLVVGGSDAVMGAQTIKLMDVVNRQAERPYPVAVALRRDGEDVIIHAEIRDSAPQFTENLAVQLVRYSELETVEIERGENRGRTLDYVNIVKDWSLIASWDSAEPLRVRTSAPGPDPVVVIVQENRFGPIHAVARLR